MAHIGREILSKNTLKRKAIEIPEWGGTIVLRELSGREAIPVSQGALEISEARRAGDIDTQKALTWQAETVCYGWINEDGSQVLALSDIDELLKTQPHSVLERIAKEIRILSGMERAQPADPAPVDDAKKNLT